MVEGARLESVCRGNSTVGSNPTLSANFASLVGVASFRQTKSEAESEFSSSAGDARDVFAVA